MPSGIFRSEADDRRFSYCLPGVGGGGNEQRTDSGRSITKRDRIHTRISGVFENGRAVRAQNGNSVVAVPVFGRRQTERSVPGVSQQRIPGDGRLVFDYFTSKKEKRGKDICEYRKLITAVVVESRIVGCKQTVRGSVIRRNSGQQQMGIVERFSSILSCHR